MKGWLFLVIAIVGEVIATSALKSSEGFTKLAPSAVVIIGYGIAFYFLSLVLKSIPVGVAYAVWADRKFNRMRPSMARILCLETRSAKAG